MSVLCLFVRPCSSYQRSHHCADGMHSAAEIRAVASLLRCRRQPWLLIFAQAANTLPILNGTSCFNIADGTPPGQAQFEIQASKALKPLGWAEIQTLP